MNLKHQLTVSLVLVKGKFLIELTDKVPKTKKYQTLSHL